MQEAIHAQKTITVSLPDDIKDALDEAARDVGQGYSDIVCEALRDYLFTPKFRRLREHMTSKAQAQGIHTDQDVFDRFIEPVAEADPVLPLGTQPAVADVDDASLHHDRYLTHS